MAQAQVAVARRPAGERRAVAHDASGMATRVDWGQTLPPTRRVRAAPGGLERAATRAWAAAGLPVVGVHPRPARDCARATGPMAQTAAVEARARAPGADGRRPPPRPRPDAQRHARRALWGRRQPRSVRRTAAPHRLAGTRARLTQAMVAPRTWRTAASAPRDHDRETTRRASPLGRDHEELWPSAQGMGPVWARTGRLARPAWGMLTRQPSAA